MGLRAEVLRKVLASISQEEVLAILPETTLSLRAMAALGQDSMAQAIQNWQKAQAARLHHLTLQLQANELPVVEEALSKAMAQVKGHTQGPNMRGQAMVVICQFYLEQGGIV